MSGNVTNHVWVEDSTHERGGYWTRAQGNSAGSSTVNPQPGTKQQARNRYLTAVSTTVGSFETADWPSGANITELNIFCTPATPEAAQTGDYGIIVIDAANDALAEAMLTQTESASDDVQWYPIPPNEIVRIPLTAALSNGQFGGGRVDCLSVGVAMNFWIGAS